jgi:hypothetical protein
MLHPEQHVTSTLSYHKDPRYIRLKSYLKKRKSPLEGLTADFISAADRNKLDWRLLPAIATLESSAGKRYQNNNVFGWDSCRVRFPSVRDGIHHVAGRLATSDLYRDKDLDGILKTYNPYASYPGRIKRIMRTLGPALPDFAPTLN